MWSEKQIIGFIDWDMAGPPHDRGRCCVGGLQLDYARTVVTAEGFKDFDRRGERLRIFLEAYGWDGPRSGVLETVDRVVAQQIDIMQSRAAAGDPTYARMVQRGRHLDLESARTEIQQMIQATTLAP